MEGKLLTALALGPLYILPTSRNKRLPKLNSVVSSGNGNVSSSRIAIATATAIAH
jgi:hypothetical protein